MRPTIFLTTLFAVLGAALPAPEADANAEAVAHPPPPPPPKHHGPPPPPKPKDEKVHVHEIWLSKDVIKTCESIKSIYFRLDGPKVRNLECSTDQVDLPTGDIRCGKSDYSFSVGSNGNRGYVLTVTHKDKR